MYYYANKEVFAIIYLLITSGKPISSTHHLPEHDSTTYKTRTRYTGTIKKKKKMISARRLVKMHETPT